MASYAEWNQAIADYSATGLHPGDTYYLSVDDDALIEIGHRLLNFDDPSCAADDFERAVRARCVLNGGVRLPIGEPLQNGVTPICVAFLAAMVLAAHRMAPEDDIAEINYFTRLREILKLPDERGRPNGMEGPGAPEEQLWKALNSWVLRNGWQPTAQRGQDGPSIYTNYPLSQSLLRTGDKEKLERDFRNAEHDLGRYADRERVGTWFFNRATSGSTHHIRKLANESSADRYDAITDAVFEVFASVDWDVHPFDRDESTRQASQRRLIAGLYREYDPVFGDIQYHLLPRQQSKAWQADLIADRDGVAEPLYREPDGGFRPLWPVDPGGGQNYRIEGDPNITELFLPQRDFWILTRDPRDETSSVFASRGAPRIGQTFLLLCKSSCDDQLNLYKDEGLMDWDGDPIEVPGFDGWSEYRECMVISANWDGIIPQMQELFDELRPRDDASISLRGGLKIGNRDIWVEGFSPRIKVASFLPNMRIAVSDLRAMTDESVFDESVDTDIEFKMPDLGSGDFLIEAIGRDGQVINRRHFRLLPWDAVQIAEPGQKYGTAVGDQVLRGALLFARPPNDTESEVSGS